MLKDAKDLTPEELGKRVLRIKWYIAGFISTPILYFIIIFILEQISRITIIID
ncbi:hypothetical protein LCGC14_0854930 [marine sediment metagenome]|uniref:Uncharacterized protein n=1 Tax=marine sediment metagenome TaxID=412755 RepID=A0A0F9PUE6_9ZZZZ